MSRFRVFSFQEIINTIREDFSSSDSSFTPTLFIMQLANYLRTPSPIKNPQAIITQPKCVISTPPPLFIPSLFAFNSIESKITNNEKHYLLPIEIEKQTAESITVNDIKALPLPNEDDKIIRVEVIIDLKKGRDYEYAKSKTH